MIARILVACAVEGRDELITPYMVPSPDEAALFEVRTYHHGDFVPTEVRGDLRADAALKIAVRSANGTDEAIEVMSRTRSGLERSVVLIDPMGGVEFRFAGADTLAGAPAECSAARDAWKATLSAWRALAPPANPRQQPDASASAPSNGPLDDRLSVAIREAIGDLVVEVDLSQVEELIRSALGAERRAMAEPLAERLSARLLESLGLRQSESLARAVVEAVALVVPNPERLARAVAADVGGLLAKMPAALPPTSSPGEPGLVVEGWRFTIGMEQLQLRLDAIEDQLHKSAGLLQVMGDQIEAVDRAAAMAARLTTSADRVQQLVGRVEEQLSASSANSTGADSSETPDDVARLTRKLRQCVAQFDRLVARMDSVLERDDGQPVTPLVLARAAGEPPPRRPARLSGPIVER